MQNVTTKLELTGDRVPVVVDEALAIIVNIFKQMGCPDETSQVIAEHLIDANLCGVESHGLMRVMQYVEQMRNGTMRVDLKPEVMTTETGATVVDGLMTNGIPVMALAYETSMNLAVENGLSAVSIINTGHTGRHGAFADEAASKGFLTICTGGGNHKVHC